MKSSIPLDDEQSGIRDLKHRWDEEDKTRDELERQERRAFLEQEANELFAPLENHLTRLDKVILEANAAVEIDPTWEHLDERKLRRTAKVLLRETATPVFNEDRETATKFVKLLNGILQRRMLKTRELH